MRTNGSRALSLAHSADRFTCHVLRRAYQSADRSRVDYAQAYEEMIGTYCKLEDGLRAVLPALLREMEDMEKDGAFAAG